MPQRDTAPRRTGGQKQNTFFGGAAILAAGILIVKLIGMFYKIPLINIIGEQGERPTARPGKVGPDALIGPSCGEKSGPRRRRRGGLWPPAGAL